MKPGTANGPMQAGQSVDALIEQGRRSFQLGDIPAAIRDISKAVALDPNNVYALMSLGVAEAACGRLDDALSRFRAVVTIDPHHQEARANVEKILTAQTMQEGDVGSLLTHLRLLTESAPHANGDESLIPVLMMRASIIGQKLYAAGRRECIDASRIALRLRPNQLLGHIDINNYLSVFNDRAQLGDFTRDIPAEQLGKQIFIACFPKSGSTLLNRLLCEATGFDGAQFVSAYGQNEQDIYLPSLLDGARRNLVIQQHCRATGSNLHLMQAFGIRPIILVRNIFDVLLSWKEFSDGGAFGDTFYSTYQRLSDEQRYALAVDDRAPWYLSFFAGWQRAVAAGQIDGFWLTYETLIADPRGTIEAILKFQGIAPDSTRVARAVELAGRKDGNTRFNKGIAGRGSAAFASAHVEQIRRIAAYHPDVDFSLIGL